MNTKKALYNYCLRLADNNLIAGQRLAEWCSNGPITWTSWHAAQMLSRSKRHRKF